MIRVSPRPLALLTAIAAALAAGCSAAPSPQPAETQPVSEPNAQVHGVTRYKCDTPFTVGYCELSSDGEIDSCDCSAVAGAACPTASSSCSSVRPVLPSCTWGATDENGLGYWACPASTSAAALLQAGVVPEHDQTACNECVGPLTDPTYVVVKQCPAFSVAACSTPDGGAASCDCAVATGPACPTANTTCTAAPPVLPGCSSGMVDERGLGYWACPVSVLSNPDALLQADVLPEHDQSVCNGCVGPLTDPDFVILKTITGIVNGCGASCN
jgi:hypothetical protein